jgi:mRNA interferase HigB
VWIIKKGTLNRYITLHPDAAVNLDLWYRLTKAAGWNDFAELRQTFGTASIAGNLTVFNIKGNAYRLIVLIDYRSHKVFIRHFLTHADYDKEEWKRDPWY